MPRKKPEYIVDEPNGFVVSTDSDTDVITISASNLKKRVKIPLSVESARCLARMLTESADEVESASTNRK